MANNTKDTGTFSDAEREAMKARSKELAAEARANKKKSDGEKDVLDAIAAMPEPDRGLATRIHTLVTETSPELWPKTWYGMPAYSIKGKDVVCFFQAASKFESRYSTLGFNDAAKLDAGNMWATTFAVARLTKVEEEKIVELVQKATSGL